MGDITIPDRNGNNNTIKVKQTESLNLDNNSPEEITTTRKSARIGSKTSHYGIVNRNVLNFVGNIVKFTITKAGPDALRTVSSPFCHLAKMRAPFLFKENIMDNTGCW